MQLPRKPTQTHPISPHRPSRVASLKISRNANGKGRSARASHEPREPSTGRRETRAGEPRTTRASTGTGRREIRAASRSRLAVRGRQARTREVLDADQEQRARGWRGPQRRVCGATPGPAGVGLLDGWCALDLSRNHGAPGYLAGRNRRVWTRGRRLVVLSLDARLREETERVWVRYVLVLAEKPTFVEIKEKIVVSGGEVDGRWSDRHDRTGAAALLASSGRGLAWLELNGRRRPGPAGAWLGHHRKVWA